MSDPLNTPEMNASEVYPDPLGIAKGVSMSLRLADAALAGDMPVSRLFSSLPASVERDVRREVREERREAIAPSEPES